jgi:hypothetical protein
MSSDNSQKNTKSSRQNKLEKKMFNLEKKSEVFRRLQKIYKNRSTSTSRSNYAHSQGSKYSNYGNVTDRQYNTSEFQFIRELEKLLNLREGTLNEDQVKSMVNAGDDVSAIVCFLQNQEADLRGRNIGMVRSSAVGKLSSIDESSYYLNDVFLNVAKKKMEGRRTVNDYKGSPRIIYEWDLKKSDLFLKVSKYKYIHIYFLILKFLAVCFTTH